MANAAAHAAFLAQEFREFGFVLLPCHAERRIDSARC
jgi:hypothetical protein